MNSIKLRGIVMEDFCNYKEPSMFLITSYCDFKCCYEAGLPNSVCQNEPMIKDTEVKDYDINHIIQAYLDNDISQAVVFGGLEPMMQFTEVLNFIDEFRKVSDDPIIIYTGYNKDELEVELEDLIKYGKKNIIVKFGRFVPDQESHFDEVLGVELCSPNQVAERL